VDQKGRALAPILTWHDPRTLPWLDWWRSRIPEADLYRITGLPIDYIYSVNKLLWHRERSAEVFSRAQTWLCVADWVTYRLTGRRSTSLSMASRTMLLDITRRDWSDELLRLAELPAGLLPDVFPSGTVIGAVTPEAARSTGLAVGIPVSAGGHDHICAALAAGVIAPGMVLDSAGTAEAVLLSLDSPVLDEASASSGLCCGCHTVRDRYYLIGGVMSGGVVNWVSRPWPVTTPASIQG
jgi:xylulokinase